MADPGLFLDEFNGAKQEYLNENPSATATEQSEFALLGILNKGINLYKTEPNSNTLKPLIAYENSAKKLALAAVTCP